MADEHNGSAFRITGTRKQNPTAHYQKTRASYRYDNNSRVLNSYAATGGGEDSDAIIAAKRYEFGRSGQGGGARSFKTWDWEGGDD